MENVKSFNLNKCPHCGNDILVEFELAPPAILTVLTPDNISSAKQQVLEAVNAMTDMSEEEKEKIKSWVMDPDTAFGPKEVEAIISDIRGIK